MMDTESGIWERRHEALDRAIVETIESAQRDFGECQAVTNNFEEAQLQACLESLHSLRHFGGAAFEFFSEQNSPRYVFRTLLDQMSIDLNLLQKAMFQRRCTGVGRETVQAETLRLADSLALNALKPAIESGFVKLSAVVTHLARLYDVRLLPYNDVALIGIPYTTYDNNGAPTLDYLAIPHEVGHVLFERGKPPRQDESVDGFLPRKIGGRKIAWRHNWLEELFADAYSCLVAGPVAVLSLQNLLRGKSDDAMRQDTGEHPIAILRPLIQTQLLRKITDSGNRRLFAKVPDLLDEEWLRETGKGALDYSYSLQSTRQKLTGQEIVDNLDDVSEAIFETLKGMMPADVFTTWTTDLEDGQDLSELTRQFAKRRYPVQEQGYYRFKARLAELSVRSRDADELISLVLFEDWETEHGFHNTER